MTFLFKIMFKNKIEKTLYNPAVGLFPLLLVIFLISKIPVYQAVEAGLTVTTAMLLIFIWFTGKRIFQSFLFTSLLTLLIFNGIMMVIPEKMLQQNAFIVLEFIFTLILLVIKLNEAKILDFVDVNLKVGIKIHLKPAMQMSFFVTKIILYCAPFHLGLLILFSQYPSEHLHDYFLTVFKSLFPLLIIGIGIVELLNIRWIGSQINRERYLPIVDMNSRVIGHIALSESLTFDKKFLHPVVRVIFKHDKKLYLRARPQTSHYEVGKMCLPVEDYVNYGENIDDAAKRILYNAVGKNKLELHFMLKYVHEVKDRRCINYLYIVNLDSEKLVQAKTICGGKWWTEKQIVENLTQDYFSSSFESEFEYIQSTVMMADHYGVPVGMYSKTART